MRRDKYNLGLAAALALALPAAAMAAKLDLSSEVDFKAANYGHLIYQGARTSHPLYTESISLGFIIKDIKLEKAPKSSMEVGIVLNSAGVGSASSGPVTAPQFSDAAARLPQTDGTPYIGQAYVKIFNFFRHGYTATFGRQHFTLGQGLALGTDEYGFPGARLEIGSLYKTIKADLFFFRPFRDGRFYSTYGAALNYPANEGAWQAYHFLQQDEITGGDLMLAAKAKTKTYTGLRYMLNQRNLYFDGEAVAQRGEADLAAGGSGKYEGYAFMLKGAWAQEIAFFGRSKVRMAYGRSSGNSGVSPNLDKGFFPALGRKYSGIERSGMGEIAGATLYDIIKTSDTPNGLPDGVSGMNVINFGADLPYKRFLLSADIYKFRASRNASGGSLQIASEYDLKITYLLSNDLLVKASYAVFTPLGLYPDSKQAKLVYAAVSAKF